MAIKPTFNQLKSITLSKPLLDATGNAVKQFQIVTSTVDNPILSIVGPTGADGHDGLDGVTGPTGPTGNPDMIIASPNGNEWQITVDNSGNLSTIQVSGSSGGGIPSGPSVV